MGSMRCTTTDEERAQYAAEIERARECYAEPSNDDLEIDDEPELSIADNGVWVSAWVWVPIDDEAEDEDEDEDEPDDEGEA